MLNFEYHHPTRLVFGRGMQREIGALLKPSHSRVLLLYGMGSIKRSGLFAQVVCSLRENGLFYIELNGVQPNPRLSLVYEGIRLCRENDVDVILAVGGGSVIDSAKAIGMGVLYDGDVWDLFEKNIRVPRALPVATILTIPAAGSETSPSSVITNDSKRLKLGYDNEVIRPQLSIINPELFFTLPREQIANGIADMLSHVFERYFGRSSHTDLSDGLCEATMRTILRNGPLVYQNPTDYDAWCEIGFSGALAHNGLLGLGRSQDWACHAMEHELSALYDIAHGAGLAILTPAWMRYVYGEDIDLFVQFAKNVMGITGQSIQSDVMVLKAIDCLAALFHELGLPRTLSALRIPNNQLEWMAKRATGEAYDRPHTIGGLKKLGTSDVLAIYRACY